MLGFVLVQVSRSTCSLQSSGGGLTSWRPLISNPQGLWWTKNRYVLSKSRSTLRMFAINEFDFKAGFNYLSSV